MQSIDKEVASMAVFNQREDGLAGDNLGSMVGVNDENDGASGNTSV